MDFLENYVKVWGVPYFEFPLYRPLSPKLWLTVENKSPIFPHQPFDFDANFDGFARLSTMHRFLCIIALITESQSSQRKFVEKYKRMGNYVCRTNRAETVDSIEPLSSNLVTSAPREAKKSTELVLFSLLISTLIFARNLLSKKLVSKMLSKTFRPF